MTGLRASSWARGAVSGHSQPHPCLALGPLPIKLDLGWALRTVLHTSGFHLGSLSVEVGRAEGCGLAGQRAEHGVGVFIPHLRGCGCAERSQLLSSCWAALLTRFTPGFHQTPPPASSGLEEVNSTRELHSPWFPNPAHHHVQKLCSKCPYLSVLLFPAGTLTDTQGLLAHFRAGSSWKTGTGETAQLTARCRFPALHSLNAGSALSPTVFPLTSLLTQLQIQLSCLLCENGPGPLK